VNADPRAQEPGRLADLAALGDVDPPPTLVARVMTRVSSEPRLPSLWQWLHRPFVIEVRISPLVLIGMALALGAAFVYVGATLR
jgi:hypothetical protein